MKFNKRIFISICFLVISTVAFCGCNQKGDSDNGKPLIYASFYPIYDMVGTIASDSVNLKCFMPSDKDPHLWEPTPRDIKKLSNADMLVINGANMERWLDGVKNSLPNLKILNLSNSVDLITYKGAAAMGDFRYMTSMQLKKGVYDIEFGHTHEDIMRVAFFENKDNLSQKKLIAIGKDIMKAKGTLTKQNSTIPVKSNRVYALEMGHVSGLIKFEVPHDGQWVFYSDRESEDILPYELRYENGDVIKRDALLEGSTSEKDKITYDPHSWMSLVNGKKYFKSIERELCNLYPKNKKLYKKNRLNAIRQLTDLEFEYRDKMKALENREFVVTHYAFAYFARDYDLLQFPLQSLTSMESPSLKTIKKAIKFCKAKNINTIFYEEGQPQKGADSIAREIKGKVVPLISMEYINSSKANKGKHYADFMRMNIERIYASLE